MRLNEIKIRAAIKLGATSDPMGYSGIPLREQHIVRIILRAFRLKNPY